MTESQYLVRAAGLVDGHGGGFSQWSWSEENSIEKEISLLVNQKPMT